MEIVFGAVVADVIDDLFLCLELLRDRIDEELDQVVVAFNEGDRIPDLDRAVSGDPEEFFCRRICFQQNAARRDKTYCVFRVLENITDLLGRHFFKHLKSP